MLQIIFVFIQVLLGLLEIFADKKSNKFQEIALSFSEKGENYAYKKFCKWNGIRLVACAAYPVICGVIIGTLFAKNTNLERIVEAISIIITILFIIHLKRRG